MAFCENCESCEESEGSGEASHFEIATRHFLDSLPFPTYRHILKHLPQKTFQNSVANGEYAHNDQFLILPPKFSPLFN